MASDRDDSERDLDRNRGLDRDRDVDRDRDRASGRDLDRDRDVDRDRARASGRDLDRDRDRDRASGRDLDRDRDRVEHLFPPLRRKDELRGPVLVVAAHPDDEVIAAGAMLAWHRQQGHAVTVVHATDGAAGDPDGRHGDIVAVRRSEGREALRRLGVEDVRALGFPDGALPEHVAALTEQVHQLAVALRPQTLYSFFFTEAHRDHRAVGRAVAAAAAAGALPADCRVLLFGVNHVVVGGSLFDVSGLIERKQHALASYASQLAYNDFQEKVLHRDHAATLNVEDASVQHAELFADLRPDELSHVLQLAEELYRYLLRDIR